MGSSGYPENPRSIVTALNPRKFMKHDMIYETIQVKSNQIVYKHFLFLIYYRNDINLRWMQKLSC